jgi:hypothetical protein
MMIYVCMELLLTCFFFLKASGEVERMQRTEGGWMRMMN